MIVSKSRFSVPTTIKQCVVIHDKKEENAVQQEVKNLNELNSQSHVFVSDVKQYDGTLIPSHKNYNNPATPSKAVTLIFVEWNAGSHDSAIDTLKKVIPNDTTEYRDYEYL